MADSNPSVLKLPSRHHLIENACRRLQRDDEGPSRTHREDAASVVDELIQRGWLEVAPEPVAEPSDPENYVVKSGERLYVHDPVNRFGWVDDYGNGCYWVNIKQPELFRKVDTPEPAPAESREEVAEAIARLLEQFGENAHGDPIKPDIAAWIAREYGKRNLSPIAQLRDNLAGEGGRS